MSVISRFLKLLIPNENDSYDVTTQQTENWEKVESFAEGMDRKVSELETNTGELKTNTGELKTGLGNLGDKVNDEGIPVWVSGKTKVGGFVRDSNNELRQLKSGGDSTKDPAGSEGEANWDKYLSKASMVEEGKVDSNTRWKKNLLENTVTFKFDRVFVNKTPQDIALPFATGDIWALSSNYPYSVGNTNISAQCVKKTDTVISIAIKDAALSTPTGNYGMAIYVTMELK